MSLLVRWLLPLLLSAVAASVAGWFEGSCPLDAGTWVCGHWTVVVAVATAVLGALGVKVVRKEPQIAQKRDGLRVIRFPPTPKRAEPEAEWGENVGSDDGPVGGGPG